MKEGRASPTWRDLALGICVGGVVAIVLPVGSGSPRPKGAWANSSTRSAEKPGGVGPANGDVPDRILDLRSTALTQALATPSAFRLLGVVDTPVGKSALISASNGSPTWVGEGQELDGILVASIRPEAVDIQMPGGAGATLELFPKPAKHEVTAPPAP